MLQRLQTFAAAADKNAAVLSLEIDARASAVSSTLVVNATPIASTTS
jgi:hypothetical protein